MPLLQLCGAQLVRAEIAPLQLLACKFLQTFVPLLTHFNYR